MRTGRGEATGSRVGGTRGAGPGKEKFWLGCRIARTPFVDRVRGRRQGSRTKEIPMTQTQHPHAAHPLLDQSGPEA